MRNRRSVVVSAQICLPPGSAFSIRFCYAAIDLDGPLTRTPWMNDSAGSTDKTSGAVPPADLWRALTSEAAARSMPAPERRQGLVRLDALRRSLSQQSCSSSWQTDAWERGISFPPPANTTPMRPCRCERCRATGRLWPQQYSAPSASTSVPTAGAATQTTTSVEANCSSVTAEGEAVPEELLSYECYLESLSDWDAAQLPSSPSGLALRAVREGRIRLRRQRTRLSSRRVLA